MDLRHYRRPFALTDFFMQVITGDCRKKSSQKLSEPIRILLQGIKEALHVIPVCGGIVAGDGQGMRIRPCCWKNLPASTDGK